MTTSWIVPFSLRIYRLFLPLYPSDFRRSYSGEMLWVFERQLTSACSSADIRGITRIWWLACRDLACVALPGQLRNERFLAPMLAAPVTAVILGFLIRMLQDHDFAMWISHKFLFGCC
jgi:hypothetical protein